MKCYDTSLVNTSDKYKDIIIHGIKKGARVKFIATRLTILFIGLLLTTSANDAMILINVTMLPILFEFANTSIEYTNDIFGCAYNKNIKNSKDIMAAVVFLSDLPMFIYIIILLIKKLRSRK